VASLIGFNYHSSDGGG